MIRQQFLGQRLPSAECAAEVEAARNLGSMAAYFAGRRAIGLVRAPVGTREFMWRRGIGCMTEGARL